MTAAIAIGIISGIISGLGIGGGTILIPALVFFYGLEQQSAQNVNLIYFVPTAIIALITHVKEGNIEKRVVKRLVLFGAAGAAGGSVIAICLSPALLGKIFGIFLLIMGIIEFRRKK